MTDPSPSAQKDFWDKAKILLAVLTPITIAVIGWIVSDYSQKRAAFIEKVRSEAELRLRMQDGLLEYFDDIAATLYSNDDLSSSFPSRISAITRLAYLSQASDVAPSRYFFDSSIIMLTEYIRTNAPKRRIETNDLERKEIVALVADYPGLSVDMRPGEAPRFFAFDIVAALRALQEIRLAAHRSFGEYPMVYLGGIDFSYLDLAAPPSLDLSGFDFTHSAFEGSLLSNCICRDAIFHHADLTKAVVWNADFENADFRKAKLAGSKWANTNLSASRQLQDDTPFVDAVEQHWDMTDFPIAVPE